ncbi:MAG: hypothetical protein QXO47_10475 [Thermoproteota archaeon]
MGNRERGGSEACRAARLNRAVGGRNNPMMIAMTFAIAHLQMNNLQLASPV